MQQQQIVVKTYKGNEQQAAKAFQADAAKMAEKGYFPTSQTWAPGSYGCGAFVLALILFVIAIGIVIFIYMLLVKPPGTLSVTYEYRPAPKPQPPALPVDEKTCPQCAERVKAAAKVCRFCNHPFADAP